VQEEDTAAAQALLLQETYWLAPEFLMLELANVLSAKVARAQFGRGEARSGLDFVRSTVGRLVPDRDLLDQAFQLATEMNHPIYDCMYLACAVREDAPMVTADKRLLRKLAPTPFFHRAIALAG